MRPRAGPTIWTKSGGGEDGTVTEFGQGTVVTCDAKVVTYSYCNVLSLLGGGGSDSWIPPEERRHRKLAQSNAALRLGKTHFGAFRCLNLHSIIVPEFFFGSFGLYHKYSRRRCVTTSNQP